MSSTGNAVLYVVNLANGVLIKKFDTKVGMSQDPLNQGRPNGLSSPAVVDLDGNGVADIVMAGDLFGNVWEVDVSSSNINQWDFKYKNGDTPAPFFVAKDSSGKRQPITIRPTISRLLTNPSGMQIYIGTGKYLETNDKTNLDVQTVYALREDFTTPITDRSQLRQQTIISEQDGMRLTSNNY